jgi:hypothetical protein
VISRTGARRRRRRRSVTSSGTRTDRKGKEEVEVAADGALEEEGQECGMRRVRESVCERE